MSGTVPPDTPLAGRHNAIALEAVRRLPTVMLGRVLDLHDRQLRSLRSHLSGAVDRTTSIPLDPNTTAEEPMANDGDLVVDVEWATLVGVDRTTSIRLHPKSVVTIAEAPMGNDGDLTIVVDVEWSMLVGNVLRVFNPGLPHTILASLPGRLVGELAELSGLLGPLENVRIEEVIEEGIITGLVLDLPHVPITRGDICRYALDAARG